MSELMDALNSVLPKTSIVILPGTEQRLVSPFGDLSGESVLLRPLNAQQLKAVLSICHQFNKPLIPFGGGTGLSGGTKNLGHAEWYVSTELMNQTCDIDEVNQTATVDAGVILSVLQTKARESGLDFAVDYGARDSATIGGMISTNAGGEKAFRFGCAREQIVGLEVVTAEGTVLNMMRDIIKDNTGPDLKQLFIGTEGTLGIVTRAVVKLQYRSSHHCCAFLATPSLSAALDVKKRLLKGFTGSVTAFEYLSREFYGAVIASDRHVAPLETDQPCYLLIEVEYQSESEKERLEVFLGELFEEELLLDAALSQNESHADKMWQIRNDIESMHEYQHASIPFDISINTGKLALFLDQLKAELHRAFPVYRMLSFGHLGDNNLHLNIGGDESIKGNKLAVAELVYRIVASHNGSISAEHGIGADKKTYLTYTRSSEEIALMQKLKHLLDPTNLLNPGKILPNGA